MFRCDFHDLVSFEWCKSYEFLNFTGEPVNDINVSDVKNEMKLMRIIAVVGFMVIFFACGNARNGLNVINSRSFPNQNVVLDTSLSHFLRSGTASVQLVQNRTAAKLDQMIALAGQLQKNQSDSLWNTISAGWYDLGKDGLVALLSDSSQTSLAGKWAELNISLLKLSGEVRFGDAIEDLLYKYPSVGLDEYQLKSIIYTHVDDQVFINVIAPSGFTYQHTTGGTVRFLQKTDYPKGNVMMLSCEVGDVRYMDVFIRIPSWAVNPTVTHGNVKYVAHPGEYCEIYRKWNNGDEIKVVLKN